MQSIVPQNVRNWTKIALEIFIQRFFMYSHNRDYHPFQIKSSLKIFIQHFICISCRGYHPFQIKPLFFTPTRVSTIQSFVNIYDKSIIQKIGGGDLIDINNGNSHELVNN